MTLTLGFIYLALLIVWAVLWLVGILRPSEPHWGRGAGALFFVLFAIIGWSLYGGVQIVK